MMTDGGYRLGGRVPPACFTTATGPSDLALTSTNSNLPQPAADLGHDEITAYAGATQYRVLASGKSDARVTSGRFLCQKDHI
jgi:hypothetical protein